MDQNARLDEIPVIKIHPNPDNPRLTFRQGELDELQESIRRYGVQVPIAVYKEGDHYVLIDGERRWRCASKLNKKTIPALIQEKPSPLQNLLLMFNIHALREQWDLLTISMKLPLIIQLLETENSRKPTEGELSAASGMSRSVIRRCKLLIEMPERYKTTLLEELKKPKSQQKLSEDLYIEMEKALKTVSRAMPGIVVNMDVARDALIGKYRSGLINNIVDFRKMARIAQADKVGADSIAAKHAVKRLISDPNYSIDQAFNDTVSGAYAERDIISRIDSLIARLDEITEEAVDDDLTEKLRELIKKARKVLEASK